MVKKDFDESLRLPTNALLCSGIKITNKKFPKPIEICVDNLYYFEIIWLSIELIAQMNWLVDGISAGMEFLEISTIFPMVGILLLVSGKCFFLFYHKDIVINVVDKLKEFHPGPDDLEESTQEPSSSFLASAIKINVQEKIVIESLKLLNFAQTILFYLTVVVGSCFTMLPLISMAIDYFANGTTEYKYPYLAKYFFDAKEITGFSLLYIKQVGTTLIVASNMTGSDMMLYVMCIYIQMHFRLLCHRLENVVSSSAEKTRADLARVVRRHQDLIELVDQVEFLFSKSMLLNMFTSCLLICLSAFIITISDEFTVLISFLTFFFMSLSQIYMICYFGDMIIKSSSQISDAAYHSLWYNADKETRIRILLVIMRAQKPCKLTAYKMFDIKLTTYAAIISRSWSYFALLRTMYG